VKVGQEGVGFLVNQAARSFQRHISNELRQFNITLPGYVVLRHLLRETDAAPCGVAVSDMACRLLLEPREVVDAAARLNRDGWLKMQGSGDSALLRPTAKAHKIEPVFAASSRWMLQQALNGFSRAEIEEFTSLLLRVLRNMDSPPRQGRGPAESVVTRHLRATPQRGI